jgi:hypothetical protein
MLSVTLYCCFNARRCNKCSLISECSRHQKKKKSVMLSILYETLHISLGRCINKMYIIVEKSSLK